MPLLRSRFFPAEDPLGHNRFRRMNVNYELGLPMPVLTTPLNYVGGDESNG
jgi:hypothetical protein